MRISNRIVWLVMVILLTACSNPRITYTTEELDGVTYIHNHATALREEAHITIEHVTTIGQLDSEDDCYLLYRPNDAVASDDGSIFILDARRPAIRKYDASGIYIDDFGREGSGPGEFRGAFCLDLDRAGNIYFTDVQNARLGSFSVTGEIQTCVIPKSFFHIFRLLSDGRIAGLDLSREEGDEMKVARLFDAEGNQIGTFGESYRHDDEFMEFRLNMCNIARDSQDCMYLSFDNHNRIDKYSPQGELIMRIDRPLPYRIRHGTRMVTTEIEGEEVVESEPDLTDVSYGIDIDGSERIWVLTFMTQPEDDLTIPDRMKNAFETMRFEVYSADGVLLCHVPVPVQLSRFRIFGDHLLLIDAYWNACVHEYTIVETHALQREYRLDSAPL